MGLGSPRRRRCPGVGGQAQQAAQLGNGLGAILGAHGQRPLHALQKSVGVARDLFGGQRLHGIGDHARDRGGRDAARGGLVDQCADLVDVGPRALGHGAVVHVLLDGRKTGLEHHGQRLGHVADDAARGAEIQQHGAAIALHEDVVRRDVAVEAVLRMQHFQHVQQGDQQRAEPGLIHAAGRCLQHLAQRLALVVAHHHVGRAAGFEESVDMHQGGVGEARQQAGLVDEAAQPGVEGATVLRAHMHLMGALPSGQCRRHVLLDRDLAVQREVTGLVDDAETAFADDIEHAVFANLDTCRKAVGRTCCFAIHAIPPKMLFHTLAGEVCRSARVPNLFEAIGQAQSRHRTGNLSMQPLAFLDQPIV